MHVKPLKFSIVIPVWNRPVLTKRAIDSVRKQEDVVDWEIIVVDDASEKPIEQAINDYQDSRIRIIRHSKNRGGSAARNTGIDAAIAPYVALLDSDDVWLPGKLKTESKWIDKNGIGNNWLLFSKYYTQTDNHIKVADSGWEDGIDFADFLFVRRGQIQTSSLVLPTKLAQTIRFDETLPRLQDWDFLLRVAMHGVKICYLPVITSIYYAPDNRNRISSKINPDFLFEWINQRREWVSKKAYKGFLANKIAPELIMSGRQIKAFILIVSGALSGSISLRFTIIELLRIVLPKKTFLIILIIKSKLFKLKVNKHGSA